MKATQQELFRTMVELSELGQSFVVCTLLSSMGHAPQEHGAKALITESGLKVGTIGGGKLEFRAIGEAQKILGQPQAERGPILCDWDLQKDIGMSCGGRATVLFESFGTQPWRLIVFGAGHVSQALCRVLIPLDCLITCVDSRAEWIDRLPVAPNLKASVVEDLPSFACDVLPGSFCSVLTMGHGTDLPVLKVLLTREDLPFIGSIGSKVKARAIKADLMRAGLSAPEVQRLHCPIGLDLGSRLPEEIAISIAAQLLLARDHPELARARNFS